MFKRIFLFLITNLLIVLTLSIVLSFVMPYLGLHPASGIGMAIFCGLFGMGGAFISLSISRWMAKRAYGIQLVGPDERDPNLRAIYDITANLSRRAGLPAVPEVGVYDAPDANAFATGPSKSKSLVAYSTGLFQSMSRDEFEAVAAHEISHIANGDMVTMTLLTGIANTLVMFLARMVAFAIDMVLRDDDGEGLGFFAYIIVVMLLETVFFALAAIPLAAFSRAREFRADHGAAKLKGAPAMISALKTLAAGADEVETRKDQFAIAKISSHRKVSLWSTHPSIEDRIKRLKKMA